jgi:hypothetical protein
LFGATNESLNAKLHWSNPAPKRLWLSDTSERPLRKLTGDIPVPASGLVTVRADFPK